LGPDRGLLRSPRAAVAEPSRRADRALALAERDGIEVGRRELLALAQDPKLADYPFYWAARADLERRAARLATARSHYERAIALARSPAERVSYERRRDLLESS
jgi:predicted RNA polymerase sigma factor